jgi:GT2 family glycosyltransferase
MLASVIVPAYERTDGLEALLETLLVQTLPASDFEIIVSDDGSGPAVERCVRDHEGRGVPLRWEWGANAGPGVARNRGVKVARGDILAFIDSDCLAPPRWLETIAAAATAKGAVYGPVRSPIPPIAPFVHCVRLEGEAARMVTANLAVRRSLFDAIGGFDPKISYLAEDWDIAARLRRAGYPAVYTEDAHIDHPLRLNSVPPLRRALTAHARDARGWRELCARAPEYRQQFAELNRHALMHGGAKVAVAAAFVPFAATFPPAALGGFAVGVGIGALKRRAANRALANAGRALRVPWSLAVRWGLQWPVSEILAYAVRASLRMGFVTP